MKNFNFGENWQNYSKHALAPEKVQEAKESIMGLIRLISPIRPMAELSFLDIGCGSGLFSICAKMLGVGHVVGVDVNPLCLEVARENEMIFGERFIHWTTCSVLDTPAMSKLDQFDLVYAWGSLHHTGDMALAIKNAAERVKPNGTFVISIYNKHWSSPFWKFIKKNYNRLPVIGKRLTVYVFYPIIAFAKWLVTFKNPFKKERGMTFYYDVVDWVGGYPFEYASVDEMKQIMSSHGFTVDKITMPPTPTGCVEYICTKN